MIRRRMLRGADWHSHRTYVQLLVADGRAQHVRVINPDGESVARPFWYGSA